MILPLAVRREGGKTRVSRALSRYLWSGYVGVYVSAMNFRTKAHDASSLTITRPGWMHQLGSHLLSITKYIASVLYVLSKRKAERRMAH